MKYSVFGENAYTTTICDKLIRKGFIRDDEAPDIVFSLGGDGTIIHAVRKYIKLIEKVKFVGINLGRLGFYTDFDKKEIDELLELIETEKYQICKYNLVKFLLKSGSIYKQGYGLNELAIINPVHTQIIDVFINEKHFETFRGTGFIASTPTGSTAYNKSLGGSVIDPKIKALQLTEIASINNRVYKTISSPLVFSSGTIVKLKSDFSNTYLTVDGVNEGFSNVEEIIIQLSRLTAQFIVKNRTDFWDRVKKSFLD